jgi:ribosomal-protein-alanine N-acetyltransferase
MTKKTRTRSTSRGVYLQHPAETDFEELADRYGASRKHLAGLASSNFDRERFEDLLRVADTETTQSFLVCRVADNAIVGTITLSQIFRKGFQNAYLGYMLFAGFTGKGYMTQAVAAMLDSAFGRLKLHRVEANVQPENKPSIAVLKRNGFTKEGFSRRYLKIGSKWRDHERWAIIREDFVQGKRGKGK